MNNQFVQNLNMLMQNPMQALLSRRLNVPQNLMNNPTAITQHLLATKQVTQEQVNAAYQTAQRLGLR